MNKPVVSKSNMNLKKLYKLVILMLLVAILPLPYNYYVFLKWTVSIVVIYSCFKEDQFPVLILWSIFFFNPIGTFFPLTKEMWQGIDVFAAFFFFTQYKTSNSNNN